MKEIHIYLFGIGNVGSTLIQQIKESQSFFREQGLDIKIVGLANSSKVLINHSGINENWQEEFKINSAPRQPNSFYEYIHLYDVERIAVDATASHELSLFYPELVDHGFHIVSANKIANTLSYSFYEALRDKLTAKGKQFYYETNVGAGLPVIQTVADLNQSGERITQINGVFSGSLGYIFNKFSSQDRPFSAIVKEALELGYSEPDPREDLSGNDVARKLLILAREAGLKVELEDVVIDNLVPEIIQQFSKDQFIENLSLIDQSLSNKKQQLKESQVLRHLGQLDLVKKELKVAVEAVEIDSPAGQLKASDGFFEIYSTSYAEQPLVIQGAGAGKEVTARGLLSDILKVVKHLPVAITL